MSFGRNERRREAAAKERRVCSDCPPELVREIDVAVAAGISGKRVMLGEDLKAAADRLIPEVYGIASAQGFTLSFALPENTHAALIRGVIAYSIKRAALN